MKLPKKIRVGTTDYEVVVRRFDDSGECDTKTGVITLAEDIAVESLLRRTLIHEILHAINISASDEKVEYLAGHLDQVLNDNPELLRLYGGPND